MSIAARVLMMHQGGWDEILIFVGPVVITGLLIYVARKQVPTTPEEDDDSA